MEEGSWDGEGKNMATDRERRRKRILLLHVVSLLKNTFGIFKKESFKDIRMEYWSRCYSSAEVLLYKSWVLRPRSFSHKKSKRSTVSKGTRVASSFHLDISKKVVLIVS